MITTNQPRLAELIATADVLVADIEHAVCRSAADAHAMRHARRLAGELRRLTEELLALLNDPEVSP